MEQLKPGDACPECRANGKDRKLRRFYLNLQEDTLLKCEARYCLWPHNHLVSSSDEEGDFEATHPSMSFGSLLEDLSAAYKSPEEP